MYRRRPRGTYNCVAECKYIGKKDRRNYPYEYKDKMQTAYHLDQEDSRVIKGVRLKVVIASGLIGYKKQKWLKYIFQRALQRGGDITDHGKKNGKGGLAQRISEDKMLKIREIWYKNEKFRDILWEKSEPYPKNRLKLIEYIMRKGTQGEKNEVKKYIDQEGTSGEKRKFHILQSQLYKLQYSPVVNQPLPLLNQTSGSTKNTRGRKRKRPTNPDDTDDNIAPPNKKCKREVSPVVFEDFTINPYAFFTLDDDQQPPVIEEKKSDIMDNFKVIELGNNLNPIDSLSYNDGELDFGLDLLSFEQRQDLNF
jgi:hypothetical protein